MRALISGRQAKEFAQLEPDSESPFQRNVSVLVGEQTCRHDPYNGAVTKGFPIQPILSGEHYLVSIGLPALTLAGAEKDVHVLGSGTPIGMGNQNNRVRSFDREIVLPDIKLFFQSGLCTHPDSKMPSSLSFWRVKYLRRLPRGNISFGGALTGIRVIVPSWFGV